MIQHVPYDFRFKTKPRKHQLISWEESKDRKYYALFHEPRTGKTKIVLDTADYLYSKGHIKTLVYIAPSGVIGEVLGAQVSEHMYSDRIHVYRCRLATSDSALPTIVHAILYSPYLIIVGINIEALSHKKGVDFIEQIISYKPTMMVVDESTTISNPKALRTKAVIKLGHLAAYKRIMTGTPIADSVLDIASQVDFLGPMETLLGTKNWYTFRARYCELMPVSYGLRQFIRIVGPRRIEELKTKLQPYSGFVKLEDVIEDLPLKTYQRYAVEMDPNTKKAYKGMARDFSLELQEGTCTAKTAVAKLIRLMQIVSGFYVDTDSNKCIPLSDVRYVRLMELIKTLPGKIIIWASFIYSINRIYECLVKEYGEETVCRYYGQLQPIDREGQLERFKLGPARFLIANPQVGGYGLDLSEASIAIYFHNMWSVEQRIQSENRVVNSTNRPLYIDMYMPGVDEKILKALQDKKSLIKEILGRRTTIGELD